MSALFVAWRTEGDTNGGWGPVGRLEFDGSVYRFYYTQGARTLPGFRPFPRMDSLDAVYESSTLFPLFANRLLSKKRPEYERFMRWGGYDPDNPPEPIVILGLTEGIRQTDSLEVFPCPSPDGDDCYLNRFFLHGIRFAAPGAIERISLLQPGDALRIEPEPTNPVDPNAVAVYPQCEELRIGYVPRYFSNDAHTLLDKCDPAFITLTVDRVNLDAPLQQRVLCRMNACWPLDFRPCSGPAFAPIPQDMKAHCQK